MNSYGTKGGRCHKDQLPLGSSECFSVIGRNYTCDSYAKVIKTT